MFLTNPKISKLPKVTSATTFMAKAGEDLRDLPQLLDPKYALHLSNYYVTADGGLNKRGGLSRQFDTSGTQITMLRRFTFGVSTEHDGTHLSFIVGFGQTIALYIPDLNTFTILKSNFTTTDPFDGAQYGNWFYTSNGGDKIGYFTNLSGRLSFSTLVGTPVVGDTVTDSGGATATVEYVYINPSAPTTGYLVIQPTNASLFVTAHNLSFTAGATAVVVTPDDRFTSISAAPKAKVLTVIQDRLFVGNTDTADTGPSQVWWSQQFTGTGIPFTTWTAGTGLSDPNYIFVNNIGTVNAIVPLASIIVVLCDHGKAAFHLSSVNTTPTISQTTVTDLYKQDLGGSRGAIVTPKGMFYVNSSGLWQMTSVGQSNIPFSEQEGQASILLGVNYFDNVDLSNADLTFDAKKNTVLITCARSSTTNNKVIAYHIVQQSFSEFDGWNISRFAQDSNGTIYAGSSTTARGYKCFDGFADDGKDIWTEIYQELQVGDLFTRKQAVDIYVQGVLSASTNLTISYDIYDVKGTFIKDKVRLAWTPSSVSTGAGGYGQQAYASPYAGEDAKNESNENFSGARAFSCVRNFQRIRMRITGHDQVPHQLNWCRVSTVKQIQIRRRTLTQS